MKPLAACLAFFLLAGCTMEEDPWTSDDMCKKYHTCNSYCILHTCSN